MHKLLLPLAVIFSLTACHERRGPEPETSKLTEKIFTSSPTVVETTVEERNTTKAETEVVEANSDDTVLVDIPMLEELSNPIKEEEEELPIIPISGVEVISEPSENSTQVNNIADGLNIKEIRISQNPRRTRVVFDTYSDKNTKASISDQYTFKYNAKEHRITLIFNGYKSFTALGAKKTRTFSANSMIEKIYLVPYKDDSGIQCNIDLRKGAKVNAFDLKAPGRIVIDIMPN